MKNVRILLFVIVCYFVLGSNVFAARNHCYVGLSPNSNNSVKPGDIVEFEIGMDSISRGDAGVLFHYKFYYENNDFELIGEGKNSVIVNDEWVVKELVKDVSADRTFVTVELNALDPYKILNSNIFSKIRLKVKENATSHTADISFFRDSNFIFNHINESKEVYYVDSDKCYNIQTSKINILAEQPASTDSTIKQIIIKSNENSYYFDGKKNDYELSLDNSIESINILAEANDTNCTLNGLGEKRLNVGENKFVIESVSEAGTKSLYSINIIRKEKTKESANLLFLNVQDHDLNQKFDPNVYEYSIKVKKGTKVLNVVANCASPKCVIKGNNEVKIDADTKKIEITTKTSDEEKIYSVLIEYVGLESNKFSQFLKNNLVEIILSSCLAIVSIILIVVLCKKKNKN